MRFRAGDIKDNFLSIHDYEEYSCEYPRDSDYVRGWEFNDKEVIKCSVTLLRYSWKIWSKDRRYNDKKSSK